MCASEAPQEPAKVLYVERSGDVASGGEGGWMQELRGVEGHGTEKGL